MVATGLGSVNEAVSEPPKTEVVVDNTQRQSETVSESRRAERTVAHNQTSGNTARQAEVNSKPDMDYLDIPAFLRRQAD